MISKLRMRPGLGDRLKQERKRLGLTQDGAAEKLGVSRGTYFGYEKDLFIPNIAFLTTLADADFDAQYIVTGVRVAEYEEEMVIPLSALNPAVKTLSEHFSKDQRQFSLSRLPDIVRSVALAHATAGFKLTQPSQPTSDKNERPGKVRKAR